MEISPSLIDHTNHVDSNVATTTPTNGYHHLTDASYKHSNECQSDEVSNQQQTPTTPSKQPFYANSNKENFKNCYIEEKMDATMDEPMDIDTSQLMPQTPLGNHRVLSKQRDTDSTDPTATDHGSSAHKPFAKPPLAGAKLVKSIQRPKLAKPFVAPPVSDFNEDEFANLDPFKSKPKIGFDSSSSSSITSTHATINTPSDEPAAAHHLDGDEWETHKKRSSSSSRKSLSKPASPDHVTSTQQEQVSEDNSHKTSQQETSPPTKQTSSVVSSSTDLSSSVSSSPPPLQAEQNPLLVLSATSTSSLSSANTNSTSSITNGANTKEEFNAFQTPKHQIYHTKLDQDDEEAKLSDEKLANLKKCQFIETSTRGGNPQPGEATPNEFLADDNLIDFKQFTDDVITTPRVSAHEFKTEHESMNAVDAVVFDSIFSNDNDFQSFLDLLEKKEVSSIKKSPKYSEFARKSLYLQFDPIAQLSKSLSPDKVKRLSLIVDKQEAIKTFLSGIAEEEETIISHTAKVNKLKTKLVDLAINEEEGEYQEEEEDINVEQNEVDEKPKMDEHQQQQHTSREQEEESNFELDPRFNAPDTDNQQTKPVSQNTSPVPKHNNTILDLDQLQLSDTKLSNQVLSDLDGSKPKPTYHQEDSLLDDLQVYSARNASQKPQSTRTNKTQQNQQPAESHSPGLANGDDSSMLAKLINENKALKEKEKQYQTQIQSLEDENEKFKTVAIEFEGIFRNLIRDKEESEAKLKNEILELTKERGHLQEDVIGVERAFDDLHRRFEKLKTKVEEFKKNEESLQKAIETYKQQLEKEKNKYSTLKKHAEEKLEQANSEIEKLRKSTSIELQTLKAELRKAEIKISSLELSVQQKDQENTQLTNLLEDLLSKVKPNN